MIIQCRKCETRFRFADALMEGDGVWVRCSRCQNVFFEENPAAVKPAAPPEPAREIPSVRISEARRIPDDRFDLNAEHTPPRIAVTASFTPEPTPEPPPEVPLTIDREPVIERQDLGLGAGPAGRSLAEEEDHESDEEEDDLSGDDEPERSRWGWRILKILLFTILVALLAGSLGWWLFPEVRNEVLELVPPSLRNIPGVQRILAPEPSGRETILAPVRLKDIRQRAVANLLVGNLQVIEGFAVNQAPYPLSRIQVRLVISDAYDVKLGERTIFAGNLLTDTELGALAETEILRELSIPRGTDVSNEKIAPGGEIPFMIVFSQEQAGAIKTTVVPAGADRAP